LPQLELAVEYMGDEIGFFCDATILCHNVKFYLTPQTSKHLVNFPNANHSR